MAAASKALLDVFSWWDSCNLNRVFLLLFVSDTFQSVADAVHLAFGMR